MRRSVRRNDIRSITAIRIRDVYDLFRAFVLLYAVEQQLHTAHDLGLQFGNVGSREELGHCTATGLVDFPAGGADGSVVVTEHAVEPGIFVELVVGVEEVKVGWIVYVDFPGIDADDGACSWSVATIEGKVCSLIALTVFSMKLLNMKGVLAVLDAIVVQLV